MSVPEFQGEEIRRAARFLEGRTADFIVETLAALSRGAINSKGKRVPLANVGDQLLNVLAECTYQTEPALVVEVFTRLAKSDEPAVRGQAWWLSTTLLGRGHEEVEQLVWEELIHDPDIDIRADIVSYVSTQIDEEGLLERYTPEARVVVVSQILSGIARGTWPRPATTE